MEHPALPTKAVLHCQQGGDLHSKPMAGMTLCVPCAPSVMRQSETDLLQSENSECFSLIFPYLRVSNIQNVQQVLVGTLSSASAGPPNPLYLLFITQTGPNSELTSWVSPCAVVPPLFTL